MHAQAERGRFDALNEVSQRLSKRSRTGSVAHRLEEALERLTTYGGMRFKKQRADALGLLRRAEVNDAGMRVLKPCRSGAQRSGGGAPRCPKAAPRAAPSGASRSRQRRLVYPCITSRKRCRSRRFARPSRRPPKAPASGERATGREAIDQQRNQQASERAQIQQLKRAQSAA